MINMMVVLAFNVVPWLAGKGQSFTAYIFSKLPTGNGSHKSCVDSVDALMASWHDNMALGAASAARVAHGEALPLDFAPRNWMPCKLCSHQHCAMEVFAFEVFAAQGLSIC